MPWGSVTLNPGVNVERTPVLLRAGISQSSLIRFRDSLVQKYGGWQKFLSVSVSGVPRDLHAWQDLNNNQHLEIGTTGTGAQLDVITNGNLTRISPQTLTSNFAPGTSISTVINTPTVTITDPIFGISTVPTVNDSVFFNTPVSIGGLILDGLYPITEVTGATSYQITASKNATATANNAVVPVFTTTLGSVNTTVTFPHHGLAFNDVVIFPVPTTANGVTIGGAYSVILVIDANNFRIAAGTQATGNGSFTMNGGQVQLVYSIALGPPPLGGGYGLGGYGTGGYGTGATPGVITGNPVPASDWTSDNWGEILIASPMNGAIYYWDPTGGFANASIIATGPYYNRGIFISMSEQILIAYGSTVEQGIGFQQQPLLVQWSDVSNFFQWAPFLPNGIPTQAGNFTIPTGSEIMGGMAVANQNIIWTDLDLWAMNYIGPPLVFGFNKVGSGMGLASSHAAQQFRGNVFWMGDTNFYSYSSGSAAVLPCPVWDAVFQNLNTSFIQNVRAMPNTPFNEVGWLYPSLASTSGECDSYVKMNVTEQTLPWDYGPINRSAWIDQSVLGMPIGASPSGVIYQHETTADADGAPLVSSFTTGDFYIGEGEDFCSVDQFFPDFKWQTFPGGGSSAQIQLTFNISNFAGDTPVSIGPYTVTQATEYISVHLRGRLMSITVTSSDLMSFWRIGSCKYRYWPSGRR